MRLSLRMLALAGVLACLLPSSALAKSKNIKGTIQQIDAASGALTVKTRKAEVQVTVSATTKLAGTDRSGNGVLGLEDFQVGDKVTVRGKRASAGVTAVSLKNDTTAVKNDKNNDDLPDTNKEGVEVHGNISELNTEGHVLTAKITQSQNKQLVGTTLSISVPDGSKLIVGDRNRDRTRDWKDVQVGDRVMALLVAPVDAQAGAKALMLVDHDSLKGGGLGRGKKPDKKRKPMAGTVTALDAAAGSLTLQPDLTTQAPVTVKVSATTKFDVPDTNADGKKDLNDLKVGDQVRVRSDASDPNNIVATQIGSGARDDEDKPGEHARMVVGQIEQVDATQNFVTVKTVGGPRHGQSVRINLAPTTQILGKDRNKDTKVDINDLLVGDRLASLVQGTPESLVGLRVHDLGPSKRQDDGDKGKKGKKPGDKPDDQEGDKPDDQK